MKIASEPAAFRGIHPLFRCEHFRRKECQFTADLNIFIQLSCIAVPHIIDQRCSSKTQTEIILPRPISDIMPACITWLGIIRNLISLVPGLGKYPLRQFKHLVGVILGRKFFRLHSRLLPHHIKFVFFIKRRAFFNDQGVRGNMFRFQPDHSLQCICKRLRTLTWQSAHQIHIDIRKAFISCKFIRL